MANGDDWKPWAIRLGFGIIALIIPILLGLAAISYSNLKTDISRMEASLDKHTVVQTQISDKQDRRFDELCKTVGEHSGILREHDILLRQNYGQRKEYYLQRSLPGWQFNNKK